MADLIDIASSRPFRTLQPVGLAFVRSQATIAGTLLVAGWLSVPGTLDSDEWPEWRGAGRRGVWNETGIVDRFPSQGLDVVWRAPLGSGYAGPSVSGGRVFAMDFKPGQGLEGHEGLVALDQSTGMPLWSRRWPVDYAGIEYAGGASGNTYGRRRPGVRLGRDRQTCLRPCPRRHRGMGTQLSSRLSHRASPVGDGVCPARPWGPADRGRVREASRQSRGVRQVLGRGGLAGALVRGFRSGLFAADPPAPRRPTDTDRVACRRPCRDRARIRNRDLATAVPHPDGDTDRDPCMARAASSGFRVLQRLSPVPLGPHGPPAAMERHKR